MYIPYFVASVIMSAMYFIITNLVASQSIANMRNGPTAQAMLSMGLVVMSLFTVGYMLYINSFLIKRRKKEFGLYGVLGLEKRHVGRVILWENLILNVLSIVFGLLSGCVFGRLVFKLLMLALDTAQGSTYELAPPAFASTVGMFAVIFALTTLYNLFQVRLANPIDLLKGGNKGEKKVHGVVPLSILGVLLLGGAYYVSIATADPGMAFVLFWPAVLAVILATWMLFTAGSVFILNLLKRNKRFYYKSRNFIAISGLLHRMKQNAAGLSNICILSTMVMFTVAACTSLFFGQEEILAAQNKDDFRLSYSIDQGDGDAVMDKVEAAIPVLAEQYHVEITEEKRYQEISFTLWWENGINGLPVRIVTLRDFNNLEGTLETLDDGEILLATNLSGETLSAAEEQFLQGTAVKKILPDTALTTGKNSSDRDALFLIVKDEEAGLAAAREFFHMEGEGVQYESVLRLNVDAANEDGLAFGDALEAAGDQAFSEAAMMSGGSSGFHSIYRNRFDSYAMYGGLIFLGAFFAILFLTNTVLIIYFKQVSEGMEDCERFEILQKVGMDDREVRGTINRQILIVFFLPLGMALLHMLAVTPMVMNMLKAFLLTNASVTLICLGITCAVFAVVYAVVYRITARTYYNIVKK